MQSVPRPSAQPAAVKIYNAVYSSVQVYECMVRGIAVMRRRADSYVNATQILKVAGVDKGRRTKILEKEILPGKHEIVQGGYGKYQGTWIPLERGRELALQYGIAPLLSPLFDFMPTQSAMGGLSNPLHNLASLGPRPLSAAASYPVISTTNPQLGPAPIMPGSALRLLNQGRAQGLFTPSTTSLLSRNASNNYYPGLLPGFPSSQPSPSTTAGTQPGLKRTRTDGDLDKMRASNGFQTMTGDTVMEDVTRPNSTAPSEAPSHLDDEPSPAKRARTHPPLPASQPQLMNPLNPFYSRAQTSTPQPVGSTNGFQRADSSSSIVSSGRAANGTDTIDHVIRMSTKPSGSRPADKFSALKNAKRAAVLSAICVEDRPSMVVDLVKSASQDAQNSQAVDWDVVIDDLGHTPLHLAASLAHLETVKALIENGADIQRGNYQGETPLIRAILSTHNYDKQCFPQLLESLHPSIRTIDTVTRSVLHHATLSAGVKGRAAYARYYLELVLRWIAEREGADFRSLVDLQDEHGDTALNIAARVGNRSLVRSLLDVGANRILPNKLGLRPGDFGVEPDELAGAPRAEDILSSLRSGPSIPAQKSHDVIADLTNMIQKLSTDFSSEIKSKQDAFDVTQAHLRAATRELAEQRRQIAATQQRCSELDQATQRIRNLEKAVVDEDKVVWAPQSRRANGGGNVSDEWAVPTSNTLASLIKLRRMKAFQEHAERLIAERQKGLQGASTEKEYQCRRIVALCTGIPIDKVEDMLENLVVAIDSESQVVDIGRVSGFMQKVRDGII